MLAGYKCQVLIAFSSFFRDNTFCHASRSWGEKSVYFSWRTTQTCIMLEMSVIFSFASTMAFATSLMYLVKFNVVISLRMPSFWASVKFLSFLTNAVFFLILESNFEKWDSSGRFWMAVWILWRSLDFCRRLFSISKSVSCRVFFFQIKKNNIERIIEVKWSS